MKSICFLILYYILLLSFIICFVMIFNITHNINMSNTELNMIMQFFLNKLAKLTDIVQKLQIQIILMQLDTQISINTYNKLEDNSESYIKIFMKSEK